MIALTIVCCVAVLISSILLYNAEIDTAMNKKLSVAENVVENELEEMFLRANFAAHTMATNSELAEALISKDKERLRSVALGLDAMAQLDYCTVLDEEGTVLVRTNDLDTYGDNAAHLPHIKEALAGRKTVNIMRGVTIRFSISAGAPIYDDDMNLIGLVSFGIRLDTQEFVDKLKSISGAEISVFIGDERIATTAHGEDAYYATGVKADSEISERVMAGETVTANIKPFGRDALATYLPLYGADDNFIGMMSVGLFTAEETSKKIQFIINGIMITLVVLGICILIALRLSRIIDQQLNKAHTHTVQAMEQMQEREEELARVNEEKELQLVLLNTVVKATKIALWNADINTNDPLNPDTEVIWSDDFKKMLGFSKEDEFPDVFSTWIGLLHPEDNERVLTAFARHLLDTTGQTPFNIEYRLKKKNGEYAYYYAAGEAIRDENGTAVQVVGALMDITETKNLHINLENERATLQMMFDSSPDHIFCKDMNFKYTRCNKTLLKHHGITKEKLIGKDDETGLGVPANIAEEYRVSDRAVIAERKAHVYEERVPASDGTVRLFETNKVPLMLNGKPVGVMGVARDITERKEMEEAAQSANRSKTLFLANMSHEIRTPMNSIIGFSELAQDDDISAKTRNYLINIQDSAEWLLKIINDILDISKIESGKIEFESIPFSLPDVFAHCQAAIMPKITEKGIMLYCYAEPSVGKRLLGDPVRLRQVIMNLLSNAVKFTTAGTVKFLASITDAEESSVTIQFEVKDSGIGMTPEQIDKIFKPFAQADDSITRRFGGTGLGLTITNSIIELMGGNLVVESTPGIGSRFSFELEFDLIDDSEMPDRKIVINEFEKPNFKGEVLVCEDNSLNRQVVYDHLERVGIKAELASNGKEGVDIVANRLKNNQKPFDLIFMDIHMPVMDGLDAAAKIAELGIKTPIVALTANIMTNDLELYRKSGMYDTIGKPYTTQELWRCLAKYIPVDSYTIIDKRRQAADESKALKLMKTNFVKNNRTTFNDIISAADKGDIKIAHRLAHTLKSNAGQLGEKALQSAAAEVEALLAGGENQLRFKHLNNLEKELNLVLEELAPLLNESKAAESLKNVDIEKALELVEMLEPLLKNRDTRCIKLLDELSSMPETEELVMQIEGFRFKKALESLKSLKEKLVSLDGEE